MICILKVFYPSALFLFLDYPFLEFLSGKDGINREEDDFCIQPQRAVMQIVQIHVQPLQHGVGISVVEGSFRKQTGAQLVEQFVVRVDGYNLVHLVFPLWTGAYEAHFPFQYVP